MIRPIAVLDTNVFFDLLDTTGTPAAEQRRGFAELTIERLKNENVRFVVPSPVIAELAGEGPGSDVVREVARTLIGKLRIEVLDEDAADEAGAMSRVLLKQREGRERGAIKYDALIAAIAHNIGAKYLVTSNVDDLSKCLRAINSTVQVIMATAPPQTGQQVMVSVLRPSKAAEPDQPAGKKTKVDPSSGS